MAANMRRIVPVITMVLLALAGCSEANRSAAPVQLIATTDQDVLTIDLNNPGDGTIGTITIRAIQTGDTSDNRFLDVMLKSYRVTYRRTDGGTLVPASFVRTLTGIVPVGGAPTALNSIILFQADAFSQAPFAALYPNNGGRDPETGQPLVKLEAIVDIFGETASGHNVSARVRTPLWFCVGCTTTTP